jgi:hypothetical protein
VHRVETSQGRTAGQFESGERKCTQFGVTIRTDGFGGLVVRMLASGSRVPEFKPGRSRWIFSVSSACLPPEGTLNNLSHVPTLRHLKEPSSCGKLRIVSKVPSIKSSLLRYQRTLAPLGAMAPLEMNEGTTSGVGYNQL